MVGWLVGCVLLDADQQFLLSASPAPQAVSSAAVP